LRPQKSAQAQIVTITKSYLLQDQQLVFATQDRDYSMIMSAFVNSFSSVNFRVFRGFQLPDLGSLDYRRKGRTNAVWGDNFHATLVEEGRYLWRCLYSI
jgi:hypothetical protein